MCIRILLCLCLVSTSFSLFSQTYAVLEANNIRCAVNSRGQLFEVFPGSQIFEVPIGSGLSTVYAANLWIGGLSSDQQLMLAAETYFSTEHDWYPGPLTTDNATTSESVMQQYDQVWPANSSEIATHIAYFNAVANNTVDIEFPNGYIIPQWFHNWPAHGDYTQGYDFYLAPFFDYNEDGLYNPDAGDYPLFCGDECIYFIFNDKGGSHLSSGGQPIGLEIHGMLYAFSNTDPMLNNTVFLKYKIIHRGLQTIKDAYIGVFTDFDIGNPTNDYAGTLVQNQTIYGYNGTSSTDEYLAPPPFQATQLLAGPWLDVDDIDNPLPDDEYSAPTLSYGSSGWGYGDGAIDNERAGISHSVSFENNFEPSWGMPETALHYYYYLTGRSKSGTPMTFYDDPEANISDYFAPGESHPLGPDNGLGFEYSWEEPLWGVPPGDRRMVGSFGPVTISPGEINFVDLAFVFQEGNEESISATREDLDIRLVEVKQYFNEFLTECHITSPITSMSENSDGSVLQVFPNPASGSITIKCVIEDYLSITNSNGQTVYKSFHNPGISQIDISSFASGLYHIALGKMNMKIVKE